MRDLPPIIATPNDIIGPFSRWPKQRTKRSKKVRTTVIAGTAVLAAGFVHCVVPMMV